MITTLPSGRLGGTRAGGLPSALPRVDEVSVEPFCLLVRRGRDGVVAVVMRARAEAVGVGQPVVAVAEVRRHRVHELERHADLVCVLDAEVGEVRLDPGGVERPHALGLGVARGPGERDDVARGLDAVHEVPGRGVRRGASACAAAAVAGRLPVSAALVLGGCGAAAAAAAAVVVAVAVVVVVVVGGCLGGLLLGLLAELAAAAAVAVVVVVVVAAAAPWSMIGMHLPMLVTRWRVAFASVCIAAALSATFVKAGNGTHDDAPMKARYRVDAAFINSATWRTACSLSWALAADEAGVVSVTRSTLVTAEWNSSLRLKPKIDNARSAYVTTSAARLQNHCWSTSLTDAGAADLQRSISIARSTSSCQLILLHLPSMSLTTKSALARQSSSLSISNVPSSSEASFDETYAVRSPRALEIASKIGCDVETS